MNGFRATRAQQAGMYYARRNRLARSVVQNLTVWSAGLSVTAGQYVQHAGNAYKALGTGTTGATPPTLARGEQSDGTITWVYVDPQIFSDYVYNAPATPG